MAKNKKIPCRVCGKLFPPCSYCQENTGIFRWRNFACSRECAMKYFNDTIAFRNMEKGNSSQTLTVIENNGLKNVGNDGKDMIHKSTISSGD